MAEDTTARIDFRSMIDQKILSVEIVDDSNNRFFKP